MMFSIKSFGCKVNQYEIQRIKESLENEGNKYTADENICNELYINTCAVTETAVEKLKKFCASFRRKNRLAKIIIIGCAVEYLKKNNLDIDFADLFFDNSQKENYGDYFLADSKEKKIKVVPEKNLKKFELHSRAFIKIQDGCDNFCSYCIVPYLRKKMISRNTDEITYEIRKLISNGYYEIVLSGVNIGKYNDSGKILENLLKNILKINGDFRIRFSSINVNHITSEFIALMKNNEKICAHLHLSLQSGSDKILKLMNRTYTAGQFQNTVEKLKIAIPDIGITTDIIAGFPGENEVDFKETERMLKQINSCRTHIFPYSDRAGTAAANFKNKVPVKFIRNRCALLKNLNEKLSREFIKKRIGKKYIIVPEAEKNVIYGYTENYIRGRIASNLEQLQEIKNFQTIPVEIKGYDEIKKIALFETCF